VDSGLVAWAGAYLNERLEGLGLGARTLQSRLIEPGLATSEANFISQLAPAFTALAATAEESLYVEGTARLLSEHRFQDLSQLNALMDMLERRVALLGVVREALGRREIVVRIGAENEAPAMRSLSLVAAGYGLPGRNLGAVSVIGPVAMDYGTAIGAVQEASRELSRFVEELYG
jgi:heat-inducible transcriptional repressor